MAEDDREDSSPVPSPECPGDVGPPSLEGAATLVRRLVQDVERHQSDYHHTTPPGLLAEARAFLRRVASLDRGDPAEG